MANDADIFMILLRPTTRVPVVGEAVSHLFQGQVLIESLTWNLRNDEAGKNSKASKATKDKEKPADLLLRQQTQSGQRNQQSDKNASIIDDVARKRTKATTEFARALASGRSASGLERSYTDDMVRLDKELRQRLLAGGNGAADGLDEAIKKKLEAAEKDQDDADKQERNRNFEFTFTKRVDIASTQMLNSMKAGDVFPSGTLTIHKRSATAMDGTSLVFTIQKIRLLDYKLQVVVGDTMTEMVEAWTCEFAALAYVYKNPPSHYSHGNAVQAGAKGMSQGTMRAFTMKNIGSPI